MNFTKIFDFVSDGNEYIFSSQFTQYTAGVSNFFKGPGKNF